MILAFEEYMLPCVHKKNFGMECMGCGIQRAVGFLFSGNFSAAFKVYPAIYTLILLLLVILFNLFIKFKYDREIKLFLVFLNILIIVGFYLFKVKLMLEV